MNVSVMNEANVIDYKAAYRAAYQDKLAAQLDQWSVRLDQLRARVFETKPGARILYLDMVDELSWKRRTLRGKLMELNDAGDDAWARLKDKIEEAVEELRKGVEQVILTLRKGSWPAPRRPRCVPSNATGLSS
jgi:hypothetical protein